MRLSTLIIFLKDRRSILRIRQAVQASFLTLTLFLGYQFWVFVRYFEVENAATSMPTRPSGVEAFLPIGGLTSLRYWFSTGEFHPYHPASLIIFLAVISVSILLRKSFCSWICPIGFLSERLYQPWAGIFRRNIELPFWADLPLRAIKYLLLGFFVWAIGLAMSEIALREFMHSDYWKMADVKMLHFFTSISNFALGMILVIAALSIPIRNFWCRFLCPYGALLGLAGLISPFTITRDNNSCTHCKKCTHYCPAYLPVEAKSRITSPECSSCLTCLSGCPKGSITFSTRKKRFTLPPWAYLLILLVVFFGIIQTAKWAGNWNSSLDEHEFRQLIPKSKELQHPR
ncbi:MAG: 4Fe-4S binding protein [Bdellovibrio sp.]|nr:4Fe-4S binding protein [Bdellovibrio sp.]